MNHSLRIHVSSSNSTLSNFYMMERASLCLIVISSVRMHDFELAQQGVEEKQTVHNNHKKAD